MRLVREGPRAAEPRNYCSRSCVQRAHEARKEAKQVDERLKERMWAVYMKGRKEEAEAWESGTLRGHPAANPDLEEVSKTAFYQVRGVQGCATRMVLNTVVAAMSPSVQIPPPPHEEQ